MSNEAKTFTLGGNKNMNENKGNTVNREDRRESQGQQAPAPTFVGQGGAQLDRSTAELINGCKLGLAPTGVIFDTSTDALKKYFDEFFGNMGFGYVKFMPVVRDNHVDMYLIFNRSAAANSRDNDGADIDQLINGKNRSPRINLNGKLREAIKPFVDEGKLNVRYHEKDRNLLYVPLSLELVVARLFSANERVRVIVYETRTSKGSAIFRIIRANREIERPSLEQLMANLGR